jgi:hypothetical protein
MALRPPPVTIREIAPVLRQCLPVIRADLRRPDYDLGSIISKQDARLAVNTR